MKTFVGVLLVTACFVACTHSYPGVPRNPDSSEENGDENTDTVLVLPQDLRYRLLRPVLDAFVAMSDSDESLEPIGPTWSYNPFRSNPFEGFMSGTDSIMRRLKEQMAGLLSYIPEGGILPWSKLPEGANTTSTVKVINGHVVTINETTYADSNDESGVAFRVRVIDIRPENDTVLTTPEASSDEETTTISGKPATDGSSPVVTTPKESTVNDVTNSAVPSRSVETMEEMENEIPKNQVETLNA